MKEELDEEVLEAVRDLRELSWLAGVHIQSMNHQDYERGVDEAEQELLEILRKRYGRKE